MSQREIDVRTCEAHPHAFVDPPKCDLCASSQVRHVISPFVNRGRLYTVGHRSQHFDPTASLAFCASCWGRWLLWRARCGYDVHFHDLDRPCHAGCPARSGGRLAQFGVQVGLSGDLTERFFLQKTIDGMPRTNGSQLIMALRTERFISRSLARQSYYESLGKPKAVQRLMLRYGQLSLLAVPRTYWHHIRLVVEIFASWHTAPKGAIQLPSAGETSVGLHSVPLTGYRDGGRTLVFRNSWGAGWGDRGYGTIPFEYLEGHFHEAFVERRSRFGPPSWSFAAAPTSDRDYRERLLLNAPRWRHRWQNGPGENWVLETYETASLTTGRPVLGVEVQNGFGLRMGWAFLRRSESSDVMEIPELFVWPTFRRMGIARILEEHAVDVAFGAGIAEIHLMLNEADAVVGPPRAQARAFAKALGYDWRWRVEVGPRRHGTAIKTL